MSRFRIILLPLCFVCGFVQGQPSFRVELGKDGETIADMRPVFLEFETRSLPAISPAEVARRYQRLFSTTDEPAVRVDALNRLTNIRDRSGEDIGFSPAEEARAYKQAIESYESILQRGAFGGRLDELMYQMAKAYALTGQNRASVKRLQQLVGLYPNSPLVPEARFRLAESSFAAGRYVEAEAGYRALVDSSSNTDGLKNKARYMLGWALYKQGPQAWERAAHRFVAVLDDSLPNAESLNRVPESSVDSIDDTLRILALMASRKNGADTLMNWLQPEPLRAWTPLVFDRLADLYAVQGNAGESVTTNQAFVAHFPDHSQRAGFMAQIVSVWDQANKPAQSREAMADYIALFADDRHYAALAADYRHKWRELSRFLADYHYAKGASTTGDGATDYGVAAGYYEGLARRGETTGELFRLAGDARLQARNYPAALQNFHLAAYDSPGYQHDADAGWAALVLVRAGVTKEKASSVFEPGLADLTAETERFIERFVSDSRTPGLLADLASRWLEAGDNAQALHYATQAVAHSQAAPELQYTGWVVIARVRQRTAEYGLAEKAWREALALATGKSANGPMKSEAAGLREQLAHAIYRQGEQAAKADKTAIAVAHFQRIETVLPGSETAVKGRFDAANTLLKASNWQPAINELNRFRADYPLHVLAAGVGEKLVLAYTSSDQPLRAAKELMAMADSRRPETELANEDVWGYQLRAAAQFHKAKAVSQRNAIYNSYLATGPVAMAAGEHVQLQTMRHRLIEAGSQPAQWQADMVAAELESSWHSKQTLQWAASGALTMGAKAAEKFSAIKLSAPFEPALERKQQAMEEARTHFGNAESLGGDTVLAETLFRRAELHRAMARDLMASAAPEELNELEKMQYRMLLEEEAYPFEERAIELHAKNHQRVATGRFGAWIEKSLSVLAELHPGRYDRSLRWMSPTVDDPNSGGA
ncbi:MAG: tetratricopeptide repeat protein [Marinobacter sp.]|uniref:tetratricopeptide repeat protein n=1 Tax=Marinobacter sp. TaxID=50741 RepID=UPI003F96AC9E